MRRYTIRIAPYEDESRRRKKKGAAAAFVLLAALLGASWASVPPKKEIVTTTVTVIETRGVEVPSTTTQKPPPIVKPAKLKVSPLRLAFSQPSPQLVRVSNIGDLPLDLSKPKTGGKSFHLSTDCLAQLAQHESCSVAVVFDPAIAGSARDVLTIDSESVTLIGNAPPRKPVELQPLDFGRQMIGSSGAPQQVRLTNFSTSPMAIGGVLVPKPFSTLSDQCGGRPLPPGGICDVMIGFGPAAAVAYEGELKIGGRGNELIAHAMLRGTGVARPVIAPIKLDIEPKHLEFGNILGRTKSFTVVNPGTRGVRISQVQIEPSGVFRIVKSDCVNRLLEPNGRCTVTVNAKAFRGGSAAKVIVQYDGGSETAGFTATDQSSR